MSQSPVEIARATLLLLASKGLPPTPEHYTRVYHSVAGSPATDPTERERAALARLLFTASTLVENTSNTTESLAQGLGAHQQNLHSSLHTMEQIEDKQPLLRMLAEVLSTSRALSAQVETSRLELHETQSQLHQLQQEVEHIREHAQADPLTGGANRVGLEYQLAKELARVKRQQVTLSVAVWALDNLQDLTQRHGVVVRDRAIAHCVDLARSVLRESDLLGRMGDTLFVAVLSETDINGAQFVLSRLKSRLCNTPLICEAGRIELGFSAGITQAAASDSSQGILVRAEQALARAKEIGPRTIHTLIRSA